MIIADTGAILALIDADDSHHDEMIALYDERPDDWVLPWAILAEVDYLLLTYVGAATERAFVRDLAAGSYNIEWGRESDIERARELTDRHRTRIGR